MKNICLASLALAVALGSGAAFAQSIQPAQPAQAAGAAAPRSIDQADVFMGLCQQPQNRDACVMYFAGFTNGALVQSLIDKQHPRYCVPQNINRGDQLAAVMAWMKVNPQDLLGPTAAAVYKALIGTYPCR